MAAQYLSKTIVKAKRTETPRWGMAADGYTLRSGAPTSFLVQLEGEKIWRRLMCWQFSNAGTCFLRIKKVCYIVRGSDMPRPEGEGA